MIEKTDVLQMIGKCEDFITYSLRNLLVLILESLVDMGCDADFAMNYSVCISPSPSCTKCIILYSVLHIHVIEITA